MKNDTLFFDTIIIGGGPAGIMAALSVKKHHPNFSVVILDKTFELGRKFLTSGAGRGNLTNVNLEKGSQGYFYGDQQFIASVFSQFGFVDIMRFFEELGVPTYEEKKTSKGKIFPYIDNAKTVRDMLVDVLIEKDIVIFCNENISSLSKFEDTWKVKTNDKELTARFIILSAGGKTYPALGADGSGYALAQTLGHTIIPPVVTAVPIVSKNLLSHLLQGEKVIMEVTSMIDGEDTSNAIGEVMFTQYGFSGPAIFDVSHDFSLRINRQEVRDTAIRLSFFPNKAPEEVRKIIDSRCARHATQLVAHVLWGLFTEKTSGAICAVAGLPKDRLARDVTRDEVHSLVKVLTAYTAKIVDTRGWNEGEFTAGGVDTNEVDQKTLESKIVKGVYFSGEILDVDGQVGGFNLSWAWSTGWVVGKLGI